MKRNWLAEVKTNVESRPTAAVIYGVPGIGKTSIGASVPGAIVMYDCKEDGITTLKTSGRVPKDVPQLPPIQSWSDAIDAIDFLTNNEHPYRCLVIDTLGGMESLCHDYVTQTEYGGKGGKDGFASYMEGYRVSLTPWRMFLGRLDTLRDQKKMSVILLAHSKVINFKNPEGADYDRYLPDCNEKTWGVTHKWADVVLFANYVVVVDKSGKGQGGMDRSLYTQFHPAYDAKNRHGLPPEIPMGNSGGEAWNNIINAIQEGRGTNHG